MKKEYFVDNLSVETLAKFTDKMLNYEKTTKNRSIKTNLLKIIPIAAAVVLVIGAINILPVFMGSDIDRVNPGASSTPIEITEPVDLFLPPIIEKSFFEEKILAVIPEDRGRVRDKIMAYYTLKDSGYVLDSDTSDREKEQLLEYLYEYTDLTGNDMMRMCIDNGLLESIKLNADDFESALFDVIQNSSIKTSIPNLIIRFYGKWDYIDPDDFTDMVLTRDGIPVENNLTYTGKFDKSKFEYKDITDFYFAFEDENIIPGVYGFTGKYKDVSFEVYNKIIEAYPLGDTPANPDDLFSVSFGGYTDINYKYISLVDIGFHFYGVHQAFNESDLTNLKLTLNGEEIGFSTSYLFRYLELYENNQLYTGFNLILEDPLTVPGTYRLTGEYMGKPFESLQIDID